jgi:hypothetical protein
MLLRMLLPVVFLLPVGLNVEAAASQDPPAVAPLPEPVLTPEMEMQLERQRAEQEVAGLPRVEVADIEEVIRFWIENDMLAMQTTLSPLQGQVRVITPALPGIVRVHVLDLQPPTDTSAGRNFTLIHNDLTQPGAMHVITHTYATAGRLNLARDAESDAMRSTVELIQDPPGTPLDPDVQPVRLNVRIYSNPDGGEPDVNLRLSAATFSELRQRYPAELEKYLRPILRDFQQDHKIFAVDERLAWQVLGEAEPIDSEVEARVMRVLEQFEADDFRQREAALDRLRQLGQPAALVLSRSDRSHLTPDQTAGVDTFLAEYLPLDPADAERLRQSPAFLLDSLASEDESLRRLAARRLRQLSEDPVDFDPAASPDTRAAQLQELRRRFGPSPAPAPAPPAVPATGQKNGS